MVGLSLIAAQALSNFNIFALSGARRIVQIVREVEIRTLFTTTTQQVFL
jgi:hypothetical protein